MSVFLFYKFSVLKDLQKIYTTHAVISHEICEIISRQLIHKVHLTPSSERIENAN